MAGRLKREIKQTRPFATVEEELILNLMRTADQLAVPLGEALREASLSFSQYNVLRILRGAGPSGLPCGEVADRMVRRDPDLTRLLDRLETRGLVNRSRGLTDRRVVLGTITDEGLRLLDDLDDKLRQTLVRTLAHMPKERQRLLLELLEEARQPCPLTAPER